eukprot:CFRG3480T1
MRHSSFGNWPSLDVKPRRRISQVVRHLIVLSTGLICALTFERVCQVIYEQKFLPGPLHAIAYGVLAALVLLAISLTVTARLSLHDPSLEWLWKRPVRPQTIKVTPDINRAIERLLEDILKSHWYPWYVFLTKDESAVNAVRQGHAYVLRQLICRVANNDFPVLIARALHAVSAHIHAYHTVLRRCGGNLRPDMDDLVLAEFGGGAFCDDQLGISLPSGRAEYVRRVIVHILPHVAPPRLLDSTPAFCLVRELLTTCVLRPALDTLASPATINTIIVTLCTPSSMGDSLQSHASAEASICMHQLTPPQSPTVRLLSDYGNNMPGCILAKYYSLPNLLRPGPSREYFQLYLQREGVSNLFRFILDFDLAVDPTTDPCDALTAIELGLKYLDTTSRDCLPLDESLREEVLDLLRANVHDARERSRRSRTSNLRRTGGKFSALLGIRDLVYVSLQKDYVPGFLESDLLWACALSKRSPTPTSPFVRTVRPTYHQSGVQINIRDEVSDLNQTTPLRGKAHKSGMRSTSDDESVVDRLDGNGYIGIVGKNRNASESMDDIHGWKAHPETEIGTRSSSRMEISERVFLADSKVPLKTMLADAALQEFPNTTARPPPWKCPLVANGWRADIRSSYLVQAKTPYILYVISMVEVETQERGLDNSNSLSFSGQLSRAWIVGRRYREFRRLHKALRRIPCSPFFKLPGKHAMKDNTKTAFVNKRMAGLLNLLTGALGDSLCCSCPALQRFLTPDQDLSLLPMTLKTGESLSLLPHPLFDERAGMSIRPISCSLDSIRRGSSSDLEGEDSDENIFTTTNTGAKSAYRNSVSNSNFQFEVVEKSDTSLPMVDMDFKSSPSKVRKWEKTPVIGTNMVSNKPSTSTTIGMPKVEHIPMVAYEERTIPLGSPDSMPELGIISSRRRCSIEQLASSIELSSTAELQRFDTLPRDSQIRTLFSPQNSFSPVFKDEEDEDGFVVVACRSRPPKHVTENCTRKKPKRRNAILEATSFGPDPSEVLRRNLSLAYHNILRQRESRIHSSIIGSLISVLKSAFRRAWQRPWVQHTLLLIECFWSPIIDYLFTRLLWSVIGSELETERLCSTLDLIRRQLFSEVEHPKYTDEEKDAIRVEAHRCLQECTPALLNLVLGNRNVEDGIQTIHQMLQHERLNQHLVYILLDLILEHLFPDVFVPPDASEKDAKP